MSKGSFFPLGTSKIDKIRYYKKNKHQILSSNTYKQKRNKINLERDIKWNGPYDEEFFKCFEQFLDRAIKKLVAKENPSTLSNKSPVEVLSTSFNQERTPVHFKAPNQILNSAEPSIRVPYMSSQTSRFEDHLRAARSNS